VKSQNSHTREKIEALDKDSARVDHFLVGEQKANTRFLLYLVFSAGMSLGRAIHGYE
jgi:hypothetical protein